MTNIYIKKSLYLVNRLDFEVWHLSGEGIKPQFADRETARSGSSLRSFQDIAKDAGRSPEEVEISSACVVFEEYNRGLSQ